MHKNPYHTEAWADYSVGVASILLRLYARLKSVGLRGLQADDYFILAALVRISQSSF